MSINKKDYTLVARQLLKELINDITGENEGWLFGKKPSDCVMIGMIGADTKEASIIKGEDVDNQKFQAIPSIGIRFHVPPQTKKIDIALKGKLFYRSMPSFEEQCQFLIDKYSKDTNLFEALNHKEMVAVLKKISKQPEREVIQVPKKFLL